MAPEKHTVSVNGIQLHYQRTGHGEPLVLLHGFLGSGDTWSAILGGLDRFGQSYDLIVPDLRGHSGSTNPTGVFTMRQSALDIFALLDELGVGRFRAIGMSGGGMTLLHMATQQPDRVHAMGLISATSHFPAQARTLMRGTTEESQTEEMWSMMRGVHRHGDDQIRALWRVARGFADSHDDMAFTAETLATITAPTLIVHGDRDPFFPVDIALSMHAAIPRSWLWVVPNGGHLSLVAEGLSDQFVATAAAFLRGDWAAS
ncbi:MAG: alpha/beta hydrolase [Acidobacteria bacterium]|nr:alpha/beta hydrolase [Acidobacteriota bacterium]